MLFPRGEWQGRLVVAVGQLGQPIALAVHLQQGLQLAVPGVEVGVADRPAVAVAIALRRCKFEIRQPQGDAAPGEALTSHLPAAAPEEGAIHWRAVGVIDLVDVELRIGLPVAGMLGGDALAAAAEAGDALEAV